MWDYASGTRSTTPGFAIHRPLHRLHHGHRVPGGPVVSPPRAARRAATDLAWDPSNRGQDVPSHRWHPRGALDGDAEGDKLSADINTEDQGHPSMRAAGPRAPHQADRHREHQVRHPGLPPAVADGSAPPSYQCWSGDIINWPSTTCPRGSGPEVLGYWYPTEEPGVIRQRLGASPSPRVRRSPSWRTCFLDYMLQPENAGGRTSRLRRLPAAAESPSTRPVSRQGRVTSPRDHRLDHRSPRGLCERPADPADHHRGRGPLQERLGDVDGRPVTATLQETDTPPPPGSEDRDPPGRIRLLWPFLALPGTVWMIVLFAVPFYGDRGGRVRRRRPRSSARRRRSGTRTTGTPRRSWRRFPGLASNGRLPRRVRADRGLRALRPGLAVHPHRLPGRVLHRSVRRAAGAACCSALILAPWWINYITRMLASINLLGEDGYVNRILAASFPRSSASPLLVAERINPAYGGHRSGLRLHPLHDRAALRDPRQDRRAPAWRPRVTWGYGTVRAPSVRRDAALCRLQGLIPRPS